MTCKSAESSWRRGPDGAHRKVGALGNPDRKTNAAGPGRRESLGRQVNKARVANQDRPVSFLIEQMMPWPGLIFDAFEDYRKQRELAEIAR